MSLNLQADIRAFGLSNRTTNALVNNRVYTLGDLLALTSSNVLGLRGIGASGLKEISNFIENLDSAQDVDSEESDEINVASTLGAYWKKIQPDERNYEILVDYYNNGLSTTLQQMSEKYQLSRARLQQIIAKGTARLCNAYINGTIDEKIISAIEKYAEKRTEIHAVQVQDEAFTATGIAYLVASFRPQLYTVFVDKNLNGEWLIKADDNLKKVLEILIAELRHRPEPLLLSDIQKLYSVNDELTMSIKGIMEKDGYVTHTSNKVANGSDKNYLITRYLEHIDRPAAVTEIVNQTGLSEAKVRNALTNKALYVNVGKSIYDLSDRRYTDDSIPDIARKILTAEDHALKLGGVLKYIHEYKDATDSEIWYAISTSSELYHHAGYLLLAEWPLAKIERKKRIQYHITLEEAVLNVVNSSDEILDFDKVAEALKKYGDSVSSNIHSVKATLARLADKKLILRVGGVATGCYMRKNDATGEDSAVVSLQAKAALGTFIDANIGKTIDVCCASTDGGQEIKSWYTVNVRAQDAKYIYTHDLDDFGDKIKIPKETVVEYHTRN